MHEPTSQDSQVMGGFWAQKAILNSGTAILYQWQQLEQTRCIDNFRIAAGIKEGFREGFFFSDSDAYKWLDAASRILLHHPDKELEQLIANFISILEKAQQPDGYLYTYNQIHFKGAHWVNLQVEHEFYCLGHLIEAGISHFEATRDTRLLNVAQKAADLLVRTFATADPDFTDGHEEIEIALIKLWRLTNRIEYLALAKGFLERRGTISLFPLKMLLQVIDSGKRMKMVGRWREQWRLSHPEEVEFKLPARNKHHTPFWAGPRFAINALSGKYTQQYQPVAEQTKAEGHAVRFAYLKTAEAMLARVTGEESRVRRLKSTWEQMVTRRMYVTGGIGSLPLSEGFGRDYELDPEIAYAETCAALGSMLWNHEMSCLTGEARFEDLFEWQLYNAASVGIGRDGCSYFYNNPLVSQGETCRAGWYDIPCCPSNLSRNWASLARNVCTYDQSEIRINQYIGSKTQLHLDQDILLKLESDFPWEGRVKITLEMDKSHSTNLLLRLPAWAETHKILLNGQSVPVQLSQSMPMVESANGLNFGAARWIKLSRRFDPGDEISLDFDMPIRLHRQDVRIHGCGGKFAISRGPIVYCLESIDNGLNVLDVQINASSLNAFFDPTMMDGTWVIKGLSTSSKHVTFVPYMLWGNRGIGKMSVFVK